MKGRSTQDMNALGAQRIEGAFFFSQSLFEWDYSLTSGIAIIFSGVVILQVNLLFHVLA